jgi:hypothetical protein
MREMIRPSMESSFTWMGPITDRGDEPAAANYQVRRLRTTARDGRSPPDCSGGDSKGDLSS